MGRWLEVSPRFTPVSTGTPSRSRLICAASTWLSTLCLTSPSSTVRLVTVPPEVPSSSQMNTSVVDLLSQELYDFWIGTRMRHSPAEKVYVCGALNTGWNQRSCHV